MIIKLHILSPECVYLTCANIWLPRIFSPDIWYFYWRDWFRLESPILAWLSDWLRNSNRHVALRRPCRTFPFYLRRQMIFLNVVAFLKYPSQHQRIVHPIFRMINDWDVEHWSCLLIKVSYFQTDPCFAISVTGRRAGFSISDWRSIFRKGLGSWRWPREGTSVERAPCLITCRTPEGKEFLRSLNKVPRCFINHERETKQYQLLGKGVCMFRVRFLQTSVHINLL